jgi:hypothetical protein
MGVALTAAFLAVLAAITALLAEHHANEAMIKQIQASDKWAHYQAKGIKGSVMAAKAELIEALKADLTPANRQKLDEYHGEQKRYKEEQKEIHGEATELQEESRLHLHAHTPLAFAVTMFQVAIAIGAISVLTKRKVFWYVAIGFGVVGAVLLLLGLWMPPWFAHWLSGPGHGTEIAAWTGTAGDSNRAWSVGAVGDLESL